MLRWWGELKYFYTELVFLALKSGSSPTSVTTLTTCGYTLNQTTAVTHFTQSFASKWLYFNNEFAL